jgi:hypothetical protein
MTTRIPLGKVARVTASGPCAKAPNAKDKLNKPAKGQTDFDIIHISCCYRRTTNSVRLRSRK